MSLFHFKLLFHFFFSRNLILKEYECSFAHQSKKNVLKLELQLVQLAYDDALANALLALQSWDRYRGADHKKDRVGDAVIEYMQRICDFSVPVSLNVAFSLPFFAFKFVFKLCRLKQGRRQ